MKKRLDKLIQIKKIGNEVRIIQRFDEFNRQGSAVQYSTVQYSTVQCTTVQFSTVQYSTSHYRTLQNTTEHYSAIQHVIVQCHTTGSGGGCFGALTYRFGTFFNSCIRYGCTTLLYVNCIAARTNALVPSGP